MQIPLKIMIDERFVRKDGTCIVYIQYNFSSQKHPLLNTQIEVNKEIVEIKPKCKWITSHTCRRSFCTNEFLAGTPVELIMKLSGHKSVKDFYKYIRLTPEEAGQKIKELWLERDGMNVFD